MIVNIEDSEILIGSIFFYKFVSHLFINAVASTCNFYIQC